MGVVRQQTANSKEQKGETDDRQQTTEGNTCALWRYTGGTMRAIFGCVLMLVCGAAACGGEVIEYHATPTPTATPMFVVGFDAETASRDPSSFARSLDAIKSILRERESEIVEPHIYVANPELELGLRRWARDVGEGATSRAKLEALCSDGLADDRGGVNADAIDICTMVLSEPYGKTLRGWADLIEEWFGPYEDLRYYEEIIGDEDGE
jgi:hypothetical protein